MPGLVDMSALAFTFVRFTHLDISLMRHDRPS